MPQDLETSAIVTVTDQTFAEAVLASELPVLVDFWAEWCPPCRAISGSLAELATEFSGRMVIAKLNADDNPATARGYSVLSLPTLLIFQRGEVVARTVGSRPKSALRDLLAQHSG